MKPALIDLGYRARPHQLEISRQLKKHRFSVLVCHRRFGETRHAVATLVAAALNPRMEMARFACIGPFRNQIRRIAWDYLKEHASAVPGVKVMETDLSVEFPNGSRVSLYGADQPETIRGIYLDGVVMDEVADMRPGVWETAIRPTLSDRKGWAVFIGTPRGHDLFYQLYQKALKDPAWYAGLYRADQTDIIDPEELEAAKEDMSVAAFNQEYLCSFDASRDDVLIPIDAVQKAVDRAHNMEVARGAARVLGVDVARYGNDSSVLVRRQGLIIHPPIVRQGLDNMTLAGLVANHIHEWKPDAVFIDAGRGEGVIDRLRMLGHNIIEVNFGGKASNPHYANKRAEMWGEMAQGIKNGASLPVEELTLHQELTAPSYGFNSKQQMVLESKADIKKRTGASPDRADALALTYAFPVAPSLDGMGLQAPATLEHEYDPFEMRD